MSGEVKLAYCIVDGEIHHVSEFANLVPRLRPQSTCPECRNPLVLKLGKSGKKTHHAAHEPDSTCPLTNPETALHLNTKLHIYEQLKKSVKLCLPQYCSGWKTPAVGPYSSGNRQCFGQKSRGFVWLEDWDRVELEQFVGRRKPDIVFYRDDKPIAALEICATHAVDSEKIADFQSMNLPWVEVEASQDIYLNWTISKSLPCKDCKPQIPSWSCDRCLQSPVKYVEDIERLIEKEDAEKFTKKREDYEREQKRLNYLTPCNYVVKAKAICFFRPNGSYDYHELLIYERYEGKSSDEIVELYLRDGTNDRILYSEEAPITDESKRNISDYYKDWKLINGRSSEMIEITKWLSYDEMKKIRADWKSPYIWDARLNRWILRQP